MAALADDGPVPPEALCCPITGALMSDPVVNCAGNTYERSALLHAWSVQKNDLRDPSTNQHVLARFMIPNQTVRRMVVAWLDEHPGVLPDGWTSRELVPLNGRGVVGIHWHGLDGFEKMMKADEEWRGELIDEFREMYETQKAANAASTVIKTTFDDAIMAETDRLFALTRVLLDPSPDPVQDSKRKAGLEIALKMGDTIQKHVDTAVEAMKHNEAVNA